MSSNEPEATKKRWTVPPDRDGERLDHFLVDHLDLSRSRIRKLVDGGLVTVDGAKVKAGYALTPDATVEVEVPPPAPSTLIAEAIPLDVVYEDDALIVVDKPAGLVVHPGAGHPSGTLVNALLHHCPSIEGVGGVLRPGILHRLDKNTSGLIVAAKTDDAYASLADQLRNRTMGRQYRAVVWGLTEPAFTISEPVARDRFDRTRMRVVRDGGKPATTDGRTLDRFDFVSHVALTLQTGRTHQIRVHMAHAGFPVVGDPIYGGRTKRLDAVPAELRKRARALLKRIDRQALHAWRLEFLHPITGESKSFEAEPPEDFAGLIEFLVAHR